VSDAEQPPPAGDDLRSSLVRNLAGAVGVIVLAAAAFWGVGTLRDEGATPLVAEDEQEPEVAAPDEEPDGGEDADADAEDADADAEDDGAEDDAADADAGDADADAAGGDDEADTGDADAGDADGGDAADDADADGTDDGGQGGVERAVAPGDVSLQVLDGFKEDGGAAADTVADRLGSAGYRVVARNDALTYDITTVLYNPGNEEAARQVAAELGGAEVRAQPGTLSTAVDLHVVVGRDRG
jgi:hypothetical protein